MLIPAKLESARFGLNVVRASLAEIDAGALARQMIRDRVDIAILRIPARPDSGIASLDALGLSPIHADTLVTYSCDLARYAAQAPFNPSLQIRPAEQKDVPEITGLVQTVFAEYPNHYRANPLLPREDIVAGYCEWALSHIEADNRTFWVACVEGRIAGLACSAFDSPTGVCQGVLHAVSPDFARNRIYTDLIRFTQSYFRERGFSTLEISTQVGNLRVQRVWVREGFSFETVVDTYHINALLGAIAASPQQFTWRAPESGGVGAGWLCTRFLEVIAETDHCRAALLTDLEAGATYRASVGWTQQRLGLNGPRAVCVLSDMRDYPVAWAFAS